MHEVLAFIGAIVICLLLVTNCGDAEHYPNTSLNNLGGGPNFQPIGPCYTNDILECTVVISQHGGVVNCFRGHQYCENHYWSECK